MENCYVNQNDFRHWILLFRSNAGLVSLALISFTVLCICGWIPNCPFFSFCLRYNIWRNIQHPAKHHCKAHWCRILMPVGSGPSLASQAYHSLLLCLVKWSLQSIAGLCLKPLVPVLRPGFCFFLCPVYSKTILKLLYTFIFLIPVSEYTEVSLCQNLGRWKHLKYWYCWRK